MPLDIVCTSDLSQVPGRTAVDQINVDFTDSCYNADITPIEIADYTGYLYTTIASPVPSAPSINQVGCDGYYYFLDGPISTTGVDQPATSVLDTDGGAPTVVTNPNSLSNVGTYEYQMRTCIDVHGLKVCDTTTFTVTIVDPCIDLPTQLYPEGFPNILTAPQLRTDSLTLSAAIITAGGNFPWVDSVGNNYSAGACGPVVYTIFPADNLVTLTGDTLRWAPDLGVAPGDYTYQLVGTLTRYGISSSVDFVVRSTACTTDLNVQNLNLGNMGRWWSEEPTYQDFSA